VAESWKNIGITINSELGICDVYIDGVRYDAALASPVRFSYEEEKLRLKVGLWAKNQGDEDGNT
jgi:hypothetical protein